MDKNFCAEKLSLEEYRKVFGSQKMQKLWREFVEHAEDSLRRVEDETKEKQQTCFHNLRAYGLVFDMFEFTNLCSEMEIAVVEHGSVSKAQADKARLVLKNAIVDVEKKLAG